MCVLAEQHKRPWQVELVRDAHQAPHVGILIHQTHSAIRVMGEPKEPDDVLCLLLQPGNCTQLLQQGLHRCPHTLWVDFTFLPGRDHLDGHFLAVNAASIDLAKAASSDDRALLQEGQDNLRKVVVA